MTQKWNSGFITCILISGRAGVGKSTSAKILKDLLDADCLLENFARGVKGVAYAMGWDGVKDAKGRKLLQDIGRVGRQYNEDIWVEMTEERIFTILPPPEFVIIDDWRFPNEYNHIKLDPAFEIETIRIDAPGRECLKGLPEYDDISETALTNNNFEYDFLVDNEGSLEVLSERLRAISMDIIFAKKEN